MRALDDPRVRIVLRTVSALSSESYVVGGAIRDEVIGRSAGTDVDVTVQGDGMEIARQVARAMQPESGFVPLDRERGTGRVVLTGPQPVTIDISSFKGRDIYEDLQRRDFTINALAVKVLDLLGSHQAFSILDPTGGVTDLEEKRVRACYKDAFLDDPVRILRTFRFGCALGFSIDSQTLDLMPTTIENMSDAAPERIRDEFLSVLSCSASAAAVREIDQVGGLDVLFPELIPMKGCPQNDYHHLDVWGHTLEALERLEAMIAHPREIFEDHDRNVAAYLEEEPVLGRSRTALLKLALLFHDSGKPATATIDADGRTRFFGHEKISRDLFQIVGRRLKLAKRELSVVSEWIEGHMRPAILMDASVSKRALYRLWRKFGREISGLFLLFLADLGASQGPARLKDDDKRAQQRVREVLGLFGDMDTRHPPLLNGRDLMTLFNIAPGPYLGRLLKELADLHLCGDISSKEQAIAAARKLIMKNGPS
jgi:poly(A) polymerase